MPGGVSVLQRLGLAEAAGGAPFYGVRYHFGDQTAEGRFPEADGQTVSGRGQRRKVLDHVLFKAAGETPGVTAHCGVRVDKPLVESGKVVGLLVEGEPRRARLTVAADGVHSRIRRFLGLDVPARRRRLGARVHFSLPLGRKQPPWVDVFVSRGHEFYVTPLPENEVLVAVLADGEALEETIECAFGRWWRDQPVLASRLEGAEQVTSLLCSSPLACSARTGVAPGVVLLGDAAGFLDPITGGGMSQALMTAELLTSYLRKGLPHADHWLWDFERDRRALLRDYILLTQVVLWLADHPSLAERLLSLLRVSPTLLSHLIGVSSGTRSLFGSQVRYLRGNL